MKAWSEMNTFFPRLNIGQLFCTIVSSGRIPVLSFECTCVAETSGYLAESSDKCVASFRAVSSFAL